MNELNDAVQLVYDRTGLMPEVDSIEQLTDCLLTWGEELAADNLKLRQDLDKREKQKATH